MLWRGYYNHWSTGGAMAIGERLKECKYYALGALTALEGLLESLRCWMSHHHWGEAQSL